MDGSNHVAATDHIQADRQVDDAILSIRKTEAKLTEIIGEIEGKLVPSYLGKYALIAFQDELLRRIEKMTTKKLSQFGEDIEQRAIETVSQHPGPTALLGLGIGWFVMESLLTKSKEEERELYKTEGIRTGDAPNQESGKTGETAYQRMDAEYQMPQKPAEDRSSESRKMTGFSKINGDVRRYGQVAMEKSKAIKQDASRIMEENPLMVGFIGLTVGAIVGILTNGVFRENQFLVETRQNLREKTRALVNETKQKAVHVIDEARRAAKEEAERQHLITH